MAIQDINISEIEFFLKKSYSLNDDDLAFGDNFDNHLTTDKINSQYYSERYNRFVNLKISKTAFINIPNKLFLHNIEKYDPDSTFWFYYNSVKLALDKLFLESNRVVNLITFLNNNKNNNNEKNDDLELFEQSEKYLQITLFKSTTLMEYFENKILAEAAEKVSYKLLTLTDLIELMEEINQTTDEINLILEFANQVREFAAKKCWLLNMRVESEKIQSLVDGIDMILKEAI